MLREGTKNIAKKVQIGDVVQKVPEHHFHGRGLLLLEKGKPKRDHDGQINRKEEAHDVPDLSKERRRMKDGNFCREIKRFVLVPVISRIVEWARARNVSPSLHPVPRSQRPSARGEAHGRPYGGRLLDEREEDGEGVRYLRL